METITSLQDAIKITKQKSDNNSSKYGYLTGGIIQFKIEKSNDVLDCILTPRNINNRVRLVTRFRLNDFVISKENAKKLFIK